MSKLIENLQPELLKEIAEIEKKIAALQKEKRPLSEMLRATGYRRAGKVATPNKK